MAAYLRLRQVCLVAADLESEAARIQERLGLAECYRDPNVGNYGLENVLFPIGNSLLEIVAPTRPGTAAGRFLERHRGRNGYMIILDCDDPERRQRRAESLGIRVANVIRHDNYLGVQLHPKDTGAAMIEFNHTAGGDDPHGPYAPAGPDWRPRSLVPRLRAAEIECPHAASLAARWSELFERPAEEINDGRYRIALDAGAIHFLPGDVAEPVFTGIDIESAEPSTHDLCGIRFRFGA